MTYDPRHRSAPCSRCVCPLKEKRRETPRSDVDARMMHWVPDEAESPIEARWIKVRNRRREAEMLVWYDRCRRIRITLRKTGSPMGEPSCMNCPSRSWAFQRGEPACGDSEGMDYSPAAAEDSRHIVDENPRRTAAEDSRHIVDENPRRAADESPRRIVDESPRRAADEGLRRIVDESPRRAADENPRRTADESVRYTVSESPRHAIGESPRHIIDENSTRVSSESPSLSRRLTPSAAAAASHPEETIREALRKPYLRPSTHPFVSSPRLVATKPSSFPK
ncbi:MAG: hypothetical protein LBB86_03245 [Oscillospiraceae bacterium]|jgi:hypothetical protein|nr:hypothetical protein [Oscillospiraceae bacterium]